MGSRAAFSVLPVLFGSHAISWQRALPSRGGSRTAATPAAPARQADGSGSALCCGHGHGKAGTACSSVPGGSAVVCLPWLLHRSVQHLRRMLPSLPVPLPCPAPPDCPPGPGIERASSFSFCLCYSALSWKSVELGQDDSNSMLSRWKRVPGCGQVEGALSRQSLGMASQEAAPGSANPAPSPPNAKAIALDGFRIIGFGIQTWLFSAPWPQGNPSLVQCDSQRARERERNTHGTELGRSRRGVIFNASLQACL